MKSAFYFFARALAFWILAGGCLPLRAGLVQLVSVRGFPQSAPAGGSADSGAPIITPDGRFVLFASAANNLTPASLAGLVPGQTQARLNVFLRDRTNGTTTLVSVNQSGTSGGNGDSLPDGISSDGRYVVFESGASDLVAGDSNNVADVFVRDLVAGTTTLVSVGQSGASGNGASGNAVMTPDGRYVAFTSAATNLVAGDTNGITDIFVRDLQLGQTTLVSVGAQSPGLPTGAIGSMLPQISADGNFVAFYSTATNLVPGGTNTGGDVYLRALGMGTTYWASTNARALVLSILGKTGAVSYGEVVSSNGTYVAFEASGSSSTSGLILRYNWQTGLTDVAHTNAAVPTSGQEIYGQNLDLTPDGRYVALVAKTNSTSVCIMRWDGQTGLGLLVSSNLTGGVVPGAAAAWPVMDATGQWVAFVSTDPNLTTNHPPVGYGLYVRDVNAGTTTQIDTPASGQSGEVETARGPAISGNGAVVAFEARSNVVDVFARALGVATNEFVSAHDAALAALTPDGTSVLVSSSVSTNGRYVAFASEADNLVANDTNGWRDVFVRDLVNGTNILASVSSNGVAGANGISLEPGISGDGRYVAFTSSATNLVRGDTNGAQDVFVRDLTAGTNDLVSAGTNSGSFGNGASYTPTISADGRFVLYHSLASNLASGTFTGGTENLFLRDRTLRTNYALTFGGVTSATMSADGRYIVYNGVLSASTYHVYVWDTQAAKRTLTNSVDNSSLVTPMAISSNGQWVAYALNVTAATVRLVNVSANSVLTVSSASFQSRSGLAFSSDGHYLVYATTAKNVASDTNGLSDIYIYDTAAGTNGLVTRSFDGSSSANGTADSPLISPDGRFVAYRSFASNNITNDTNGVADLFVYDRTTGLTSLVSAGQNNKAADDRSLTRLFSGDSQTLFFQSSATDLVAGDYNGFQDLFTDTLVAGGGGTNLFTNFFAQLSGAAGPGSVAQSPVISWPVIPGRTYVVQFKNDLSDAVWQPLNGSVMITGTNGSAADLSPAAARRFYRITTTN